MTIVLSLIITVGCTIFIAPVAGQPSGSSYKNCIARPITSGSLSLNLCTQKAHYAFGETVTFVGILTNNGPSPVYSAPATSATVQDKLGHTVLQEAILRLCIVAQNCLINPGQTSTIIIANWQTNNQFHQASFSGPYTALLSVRTCPQAPPTTPSCLEADFVPLRITVSVPQS